MLKRILTFFTRSSPIWLCAWAGMMLLAVPVQAAGGKLALVVGNAAYQHVPGLQSSARDAQDMATALRGLDFDVTLLTDVGSEVFWVVLDTFASQAAEAETVVFYYSGHAFQRGGINRLVPVAARLDDSATLDAQTWALDDIAKRLKGGSSQLLIFLDACRTNPLPGTLQPDGDGLAQFDGGAGTFVAFATRPGSVAFDRDGASPNSPFTGALLAAITAPGQSISDLMITVRNAVDSATGGQQTPWDQSSLRAQFYFVSPKAAPLDELAALEMTALDMPGQSTVLSVADAPAALTRQVVARVTPDQVTLLQPVTGASRTASGGVTLSAVSAPEATRLRGVDAMAPAGPVVPADLPRAIQTELARIGCYNQGIDGDWGNGSRSAMRRYYEAKKVEPGEMEPNALIWAALQKEPEKTCAPVPVVAKSKPKVKKPASTSKPAATKKPAAEPAKPAKKAVTCKFLVVAVVCS